MNVYAILNQKGGVGKTTIALNLGRALQLMGDSVVAYDSDPQGSLRDWYFAGPGLLPVVGQDRPVLDRVIKQQPRVDHVIIDGAPQATELAASGIKAATFVVIPVEASEFSVWAAEDMVELVKQRIEITDGALQAAFLINKQVENTRLAGNIADKLATYELPVLQSRLCFRQAYAACVESGQSVLDTEPGSKAALEVTQMAAELVRIHAKRVAA